MSDTRPSMLCVTSEIPWPLNTGGHLRSFHLITSFANEYRVRLVAGASDDATAPVEAFARCGVEIRPAMLPRRRPAIEAGRAVSALLQGQPYVLYRRHDRSAIREMLQSELARERPEVLYLDHLDSFQFARLAPQLPTVLDLHNIYSLIARREAADPGRGAMARRYLAREARLLDRVERRAVRAADLVFSVSEQERVHFERLGGSHVVLVENGVDCPRYASLPAVREVMSPTILFIGTLSWPANAGAARFLAQEVLPAVRSRIADATLTLVGRSPGPDVLALARPGSVNVVGDAPDIVPYLRDAAVLAVPLDVGGGTRLKILESFAAGVPVVSTPIGCEGLAGVDGQELMVAERPRFADAICRLLENAAAREAMTARARELARDRYDWSMIGERARQAVAAMLCGKRQPAQARGQVDAALSRIQPARTR